MKAYAPYPLFIATKPVPRSHARWLARDAPSAPRERTAPQKQVVRCTHHSGRDAAASATADAFLVCSVGIRRRTRQKIGIAVSWDSATEEATRMDARARSIAPRQAYNAGTAGMHSSRIPMSFISTTTARDDDGKSVAQCTRRALLSAAFMLLKAEGQQRRAV